MRKPWVLLWVLSMALSLGACTSGQSETAPPVMPDQYPNAGITVGSESTEHENSEAQLCEKYVDVTGLAAFDQEIEARYVFDDRTLVLEDSVDNELEELAYAFYYDISSAAFEDLMDLIGENESLQIVMDNEGKNYSEGNYMTGYTIHALNTLTPDDLLNTSEFVKKDILEKIDTFHLAQYAVIHVDVSWKHNEVSLSQGPQLGDGRYDRYYLFATTTNQPEFKMYEVYWEDFIQE